MASQKIEKVTIVRADDWVGLYVNGRLAAEGHSLSEYHVLEALGINQESIECDQEWIEDMGNLPKNLKDVKTRKG